MLLPYRLMHYKRVTGVRDSARAAARATAGSLSSTLRKAAGAGPCTLAAAVRNAPPGSRVARLPRMPRSDHAWGVVVSGLLALAASAAVLAVSTAQEELAEVKRSVPNLDHGGEQFETCGACHGPDGGGTRDGQVPRIGGQHVSVVQKQLIDYRHDLRWDLRMEHFSDRHHLVDAQAVADVAAYIHQLEPSGPAGQGSGKSVGAGAALYAKRCSSCHGASADGDEARAVPRVAGQHYEYLRRQFYDAVDGRRPNFSPSHIRLLAQLEHDDIEAVADYLSRLPGRQQPKPGAAGGADVR
jgi:cytochrome c553